MKKFLVVANWKCNPPSLRDSEDILNYISKLIKKINNVKLIVCPPAVFIFPLMKKFERTRITFGAQNVFFKEGPYTGEISPKMLQGFGVKYVIIGHSERREMGEEDSLLNKKIKSSLMAGLKVIFCVGENRYQRENGEQFKIVEAQLVEGLKKIKRKYLKNVLIAYEPVWAISSNNKKKKICSPEEIMSMRIFIKKVLEKNISPKIASEIKILYGGSVDKNNIKELVKVGIDGVLVGNASLDKRRFGDLLLTLVRDG